MFTCPKCKTTWSSASFICTCGERVLYIPDELKEKAYLIYGVSGYDEVVSYIKNYNENIKLESIKKIELRQRQAEIDIAKKQDEVEQTELNERRKKRIEKVLLVFSFSAFVVFLLYLITPPATRFVSIFVSCDVKATNWKFLDYFLFWIKNNWFYSFGMRIIVIFFPRNKIRNFRKYTVGC